MPTHTRYIAQVNRHCVWTCFAGTLRYVKVPPCSFNFQVWSSFYLSVLQLTSLPLWRKQTSVFVEMKRWSSPGLEPLTRQPQISHLISTTVRKKKKFSLKDLWEQQCIGIAWPTVRPWRFLWPPHQTGRMSSCGAQFPLSFCCRRCHNRCLSSRLYPLTWRPRCPGTYQPRWTRGSRAFSWHPALSCIQSPAHILASAGTI